MSIVPVAGRMTSVAPHALTLLASAQIVFVVGLGHTAPAGLTEGRMPCARYVRTQDASTEWAGV